MEPCVTSDVDLCAVLLEDVDQSVLWNLVSVVDFCWVLEPRQLDGVRGVADCNEKHRKCVAETSTDPAASASSTARSRLRNVMTISRSFRTRIELLQS